LSAVSTVKCWFCEFSCKHSPLCFKWA